MVVFRLTQEEYTSLRDACKAKGGRNISEFTRSELLAMLRSDSLTALIRTHFGELEQRVMQLETTLGELAALVARRRSAGAVRRDPDSTEEME
jgi:hypothetical protein